MAISTTWELVRCLARGARVRPLELPYLTDRSSYPPPDPTVGRGLLAHLSFAYSKNSYDFGARVRVLPLNGSVSCLPGWRWPFLCRASMPWPSTGRYVR